MRVGLIILFLCIFSFISQAAPAKKSPKYGICLGGQYGTHFLGEISLTKGSGSMLMFKRKSIGLEISPYQNRRYAGGKISYHTNLLKFIQLGVNTIIYTDGKSLMPTIRPELGYSIKNRKLDFRVGYNFHLLDNNFKSQLNTFQISVIYTLWLSDIEI